MEVGSNCSVFASGGSRCEAENDLYLTTTDYGGGVIGGRRMYDLFLGDVDDYISNHHVQFVLD